MARVISQTEQKARKDYVCDLGETVGDTEFPKGMTFAERRILVRYQQKRRRILKGEMYIRQFNELEGDTYTFIMDKGMYEIFCKYDLFPEWD